MRGTRHSNVTGHFVLGHFVTTALELLRFYSVFPNSQKITYVDLYART